MLPRLPDGRFEVLGSGDALNRVLGTGWDLIVSQEVIEHLYAPRRFVAEMFDLLRPGGVCIVTTSYHGYFKNLVLALSGKIVDSGTSRYGLGPERLRQHGIAADNTVAIDGLDSSEVWSGFRVARRARPVGLSIQALPGELRVSCAHDGYRRLPGRPLYRRTWTLN